jgi:hypothetical protein
MVVKQHASMGQLINVRRQYVGVPHATQGIPTLVIRQDEKNVGLAIATGKRLCDNDLTGKNKRSGEDEDRRHFHISAASMEMGWTATLFTFLLSGGYLNRSFIDMAANPCY